MLFKISYFHILVLDRKKYGALGWNNSYDWMNTDYEMSKLIIKVKINLFRIILMNKMKKYKMNTSILLYLK